MLVSAKEKKQAALQALQLTNQECQQATSHMNNILLKNHSTKNTSSA